MHVGELLCPIRCLDFGSTFAESKCVMPCHSSQPLGTVDRWMDWQ